MSTHNKVQDENHQLARAIHEEAKNDPRSAYAGKYVGIANGRVVAVADSLRAVSRKLRQVEPDPSKCVCIEANADYESVSEIWSGT